MKTELLPPAPTSPCGAVCKLAHAGSFPETSKLGGSTVGTSDPDRWHCLIWFDGEFWAAEIQSDILNRAPSYEELKGSFDHWRGHPDWPWHRVYPHNNVLNEPPHNQQKQ